MKQTAKTKTVKAPRIKRGDEVIVVSGEGSGADGKGNYTVRRVIAVYPRTNRVLVEGVNVRKRAYKKSSNPNLPQGGIHEKTMPIHISNVMLVDPKEGGPTRVGVRIDASKEGKPVRVRYAKASGSDFKD